MSVDKPEAQGEAETHALRTMADAIIMQGKQVSEHISANTRAMEKLGDRVGDLSTRVTRLEEQKHGREIEKLSDDLRGAFRRINDLESTRDKMTGAKAFFDWMQKNAPWIMTMAAGLLLAFGWQRPTA